MGIYKTRPRQFPAVSPFSRRECLKVLGLALLGSPALAAQADQWRAKAKQNLKLGIFTSVYSRLPLAEAARRIQADGFTTVVNNYTFADVRFNPAAPDWQAVKQIRDAFERQSIELVGLFGYYNVVSPDAAKRKLGEERMELLIANWKRLGSPNISTETGTFNTKSEWLESPANATEEGYRQCRDALGRLVRLAEKAGAVISIEPYWRNVIDSIERAERLFHDINSPALKLVMDPCNFFRKEDLPRMKPMLEEMFRRLGPQIVIAHAKDVKASDNGTELPAAGKGVLDYPLYLRLLAQLDRPLPLLLEHLTLADVPGVKSYLLGQFEKV